MADIEGHSPAELRRIEERRAADHAHALAQLRHLYAQMLGGQVRDCAQAARGLLGPAIEMLERAETPKGR